MLFSYATALKLYQTICKLTYFTVLYTDREGYLVSLCLFTLYAEEHMIDVDLACEYNYSVSRYVYI
jgi:hypothetical protein